MVNAQDWLDKNYPKENRKNVKEIKVESTSEIVTWIIGERSGFQKLEGSLNLTDFPNLERLCLPDNNLTSLDCSQNFKLRVLDCSGNKLTELNVNACLELKALDCSKNFLTKLVTEYNHELEELDISNNNFPAQDLSFLSHLVNLKIVMVGNIHPLAQGAYNKFKGSLQVLSDLTQLEELDISNTDVNNGLEYLPSNVKKIRCWNWSDSGHRNWAVKTIKEKLKNYELYSKGATFSKIQVVDEAGRESTEIKKPYPYRYQACYQSWRKDNYELIISAWQEKADELAAELQIEREEAEKALEKAQEWRERQLSEVTEQKDRKIQELKVQLAELQLQAQIQVLPK